MTSPGPRDATWIPHYRVSFGGRLGTPGKEIWSNTVRFRSDDDVLGQGGPVLGHDQLQEVANAMVPIIGGWMQDTASRLADASVFEYVKVNFVGSNGLQLDQNTVVALAPPNQYNGGQQNAGAWFLSYALTFRTALARGRSHAGRIYPPIPVVPLESNSAYCSVTHATGMATAFARVMYAMEQAFDAAAPLNDPDVHAIVASPGSTSRGRPPLFQRITGVVCDRVPDVMHSRTNAIPRAEGALVAPGP